MFPISDDNPTLRTPVMTYLLLGIIVLVWLFFQGAGLDGNAGAVLIKLFENPDYTAQRTTWRHRLHPDHP